jgi:glycosyltransferase involved in cell wall biosynthesis
LDNKDKDIHILFVTHYSLLYGANRSLLNLLEGIQALNSAIRLTVIIPAKGDIEVELTKRHINYIIIPFFNSIIFDKINFNYWVKGVVKLVINYWLIIRYYKVLRLIDPDIVHSNSSVINFGAYIAFVLRKPHVWHLRELGMENLDYKFTLGKHGFIFWLKKAKWIIAISKNVYKSFFLDRFEHTSIIYNGLIVRKSLPTRFIDKTGKGKEFMFVIVGVILPIKNQLEGVIAFHRLCDQYDSVRLRIVGEIVDKKYAGEIFDYIDANRLKDKISFDGYINNIDGIFSGVDCLLMCSTMEAMGRVTVEAMSFGIPVVGRDAGGTSEVIETGVTGYLYTNIDELIFYMGKLVSDPKLAFALGEAGKKNVAERYLIETYATKCLEVYHSVLSSS